MGERLTVFPTAMTEAVCNVLAATDYPALSTSELERVLGPTKLQLEEGPNKRTRLLITLNNAQVTQHAGNVLVVFMNAAMHPSRYVSDPDRFAQLQGQLNEVLVLFGFRINDEGKFARAPKASTLSEAAQLSGELVAELRRRDCHPALLAYCDEELLRKSLFHAIQEAQSRSRIGCADTATSGQTAKTSTRRYSAARSPSR